MNTVFGESLWDDWDNIAQGILIKSGLGGHRTYCHVFFASICISAYIWMQVTPSSNGSNLIFHIIKPIQFIFIYAFI